MATVVVGCMCVCTTEALEIKGTMPSPISTKNSATIKTALSLLINIHM